MKYHIRVWLFTILAGPVLLFLYGAIRYRVNASALLESLGPLLIMMLFGMGLSLPALWLIGLLDRELRYNSNPVLFNKFLFALAGNFLLLASLYFFFKLMSDNISWKELEFFSFYFIALTMGAFLFDFKNPAGDESPGTQL